MTAFKGVPRRVGKPYSEKGINRDLEWIKNISIEQKKVADRMDRFPRSKLNSCPICGSSKFDPLITVHNFQYCECSNCKHNFLDSPPDREKVASLYVGEEDTHCCQSMVYQSDEIFNKRLEMISRPKVAFVRDYLEPKNSLWVDIGCACGEMLVAAREQGWRVAGIEADAAQVESARAKGLEVREGYLTPQNAKEFLGEANIVSAINLIEHIPDPIGTLQAISESIVIGTYLVTEVPRQPSLGSFANFVFPQLVYRQFCPPDHLHVFSERSMEILLERSGFTPIAVWTFGKDSVDFLSQAALSANLSQDSEFVRDILDNLAPAMQKSIDENNYSDTLVIIARKAE